MEKMLKLEHFSHLHQLIFEEEFECNEEEVVCSGCEEPIPDPCYSCESCNFFLHKKCASLPQEIKSHLHPEHTLLLLANPPSNYQGACLCNICDKVCKSFVYHCSVCKFDLDVKCAFPPCLFDPNGKGHQFRCLIPSITLKSFSFTCNACGVDGNDSPYMCSMCLLLVHRNCISLPHAIKTSIHRHHKLVHTYPLGQVGSEKQYCGICREEVKTDFGFYCCSGCEFVAHVRCALKFEESDSESEEEEELSTTDMESTYYVVREIKQGNDIVIVEIKHFSHHHNLILMEEFKYGLKCDGCMLPISSPYYSCAECNFFLDKSCIELPRQKKQHDHPHLLTLIPKAPTFYGAFICEVCEKYCHGFHYRCDQCGIFIDVRCIDLTADLIEHEGLEHPLFWALGTADYHCNGCDVTGNHSLFRCTDCGFNLDMRCANLPHKVWHKYDDHPLLLTYTDPNTYQFYCQICEKERDRKLWFYRCEGCDFDAHPECAIGKYPYIKFGGTYTINIHSHPLTLVEKTEDCPICHTCGEPCKGLAFECTDSHCNFIIHVNSWCADESLRR